VTDLDGALAEFVQNQTVPIFGVADAQGFAEALPGWHPKELMPKCESVVVVGHPFIEYPLQIEERTYVANRSWWDANRIVYRQVKRWKRELFALFDELGLGAAGYGGFRYTTQPTFSYRLAQVEAGIGVYGRTGVCINPDHGSYYYVGALLTEAKLTPTDGTHLDDFKPCEGCSACAEACPVKAIDSSKEPGAGYDREKCARFVFKMSERSGVGAKTCCHCYKVCPWSREKIGDGGAIT